MYQNGNCMPLPSERRLSRAPPPRFPRSTIVFNQLALLLTKLRVISPIIVVMIHAGRSRDASCDAGDGITPPGADRRDDGDDDDDDGARLVSSFPSYLSLFSVFVMVRFPVGLQCPKKYTRQAAHPSSTEEVSSRGGSNMIAPLCSPDALSVECDE